MDMGFLQLKISRFLAVSALIFFAFSNTASVASCPGTMTFNNVNPVCQGMPTDFIISDGGNIGKYVWKWNDSTAWDSTIMDTTSHTFALAGIYPVTLIRYDNSCIDSITINVRVTSAPDAEFNFTPDHACAGLDIDFSPVAPYLNNEYLWNFGDTSSGAADSSTDDHPVHIFDAIGPGDTSFLVSLQVTDPNGCVNTFTDTVHVIRRPMPYIDDSCNVFSPFVSCFGNASNASYEICPYNKSTDSTITSWRFKWGDGTPDTLINNFNQVRHTYQGFGVYAMEVEAVNVNGCVGVLRDTVINETNPSVGILSPGNTSGCAPQTFWFKLDAKNITATTTFIWDFGDGTPVTSWDWTKGQDTIYHTFTKTSCGQNHMSTYGCDNCYVVRVKAGNACDTTIAFVNNIKIFEKPKADFDTTNLIVCARQDTLDFTNNSSYGTGLNCATGSGSQNFTWDFGDGTTSNGSNPHKTYDSAGVYKVKLLVSNSCGADSMEGSVLVTDIPKAGFEKNISSPNGCTPITVDLNDTSTGGNISRKWIISPNTGWMLDTAASDSAPDPRVVFTDGGSYIITLAIKNNCGVDTIADTVEIMGRPVASINPISDGCLPFAMAPTANIYDGNGTISSIAWTFPGGSPGFSNVANPDTVHYAFTGTYTALLVVTNQCGTDTARQTFNIETGPQADFAISDPSQCRTGNQFQFTNTSTVNTGSLTYRWNFGNNTTSTQANPSRSYNNTGTYQVRLIATSIYGCRDTVIKPVIVNPQPDAGMMVSPVCIGDSAYFYDNSSISSGTITSRVWHFGTGDTSTLANPSYAYNSPGTYQAILWVESAEGCRDSARTSLDIGFKPTADFDANTKCAGDTITFIDRSSLAGGGTINRWFWDFGDGNVDSIQNPLHPYDTGGTYAVTLVVFTGNGCSDTITQNVIVDPLPLLSFAVNDDEQCIRGHNFVINNQSQIASGFINYLWTFGDGDSSAMVNPVHNYASVDSFEIRLFGTSDKGCVDSISDTVKLRPMPVAGYAIPDSAQCRTGNSFSFINSSTGGKSFIWKFSDNTTSNDTSVTKSFSNAGNFTARLIVENEFGCLDSVEKPVVVHPMPSAGFSVNNPVQCITVNDFQFSNTSSINPGSLSYSWSMGDGYTSTSTHPQHSYYNDSSFTVQLIATSDKGCVDSFARVVTVDPNLEPAFSINDTVQCYDGHSFSFQPTVSGMNVFNWTFGDGTASNSANPSKTFSAPGTYNIMLKGGSGNSCTDSVSVPVVVSPMPVADFSAPAVCFGGSTQFTDASTVSAGNINSWEWLFSGRDTSLIRHPAYAFGSAGTDSVMLVVTTNAGCVDTLQKPVTVYHKPVAGFAANEICEGGTTYFADSSTSGGSAINNWSWEFGDGGWSSSQNPSRQYSGSDSFNVRLIVTTGNNCRDTLVQKVMVHPVPATAFTINDSTQCLEGNSFEISNQTSIASGSAAYLWTFGDGDTSSATHPVHSYSSLGTYPVKLVAVSTLGCKDSTSKNVRLMQMPVATFNIPDDEQCFSGNIFRFSNQSSGGSSYYWNFGDSSFSAAAYPVKNYFRADTFQVSLITSTSEGCNDTSISDVIVHPMPDADFTVNDPAQCFDVQDFQFTNSSSIPSGTLSYFWFLGNGTSDTATHTSATYQGAGNYSVKLMATSSEGCKDSLLKHVDVHPEPLAAYTAPPVCFGETTQFTSNSTLSAGTMQHEWTFGDGDTSSATNPGHQYGVADTFISKLVIISDKNCLDTLEKPVVIHPLPVVNAGIPDTICLNEGPTAMQGFSPQGGYWTGTALDSAGIFNPATAGAGTFTLTYHYTIPATGCEDSATKPVVVIPFPQVDAGQNDTVCINAGIINFSGYTPAGGYWTGTGITDSAAGTFDPAAAGTGAHSVRYIYSDGSTGCTDTSEKSVVVNPKPNASFAIDTQQCRNVSFQLINNSTGASNYFWSMGDGAVYNSSSPSHQYADTGSYFVRLVASSNAGCTDTASGPTAIVINPPTASFTLQPDSGCADLNVSFDNTSTGRFLNYIWDFGTGDSSLVRTPNNVDYVKKQNNDTTYAITLRVENKCGVDAHQDSVRIYPLPTAFFGTNLNNGCSPLSVKFNNLTIGNADSFYWSFGDGRISTQKDPSDQVFYADSQKVTYTISLIAWNNCGRDTFTKKITVTPNNVKAFFNIDTTEGCTPVTVHFSDLSSNSTSVSWDFGDGNISSDRNPVHTFKKGGTYTVRQFVHNGCSYDTATYEVRVHPKPQMDFSIDKLKSCDGELITFTNRTPDLSGSTWHFGDGHSTHDRSPQHRYEHPGTYLVKLVAHTQTFGCTDSVMDTIQIIEGPVAEVFPDFQRGCQPLEVDFRNFSVKAKYYVWKFGDGNTSGKDEPVHTFQDSGTHYVQLIAYNDLGCTDTGFVTIEVDPKPESRFSVLNGGGCDAPAVVNFINSSEGGTTYEWDFGNGQTSFLKEPGVQFDTLGTYTVSLKVSNQYSCFDSTAQPFTLYPRPEAAFDIDPAKGCQPLPVTFSDRTQDATEYRWFFGDGDSSQEASPTHIYYDDGTYDVMLIVKSGGSCVDTLMHSGIEVYPKPEADFEMTELNDQQRHGGVEFRNLSTDASSYLWEFGDGATSEEEHPEHRYEYARPYQIILYTTSDFGCLDTARKTLDVDFFKGLWIPNAFTPETGPEGVRLFHPKGVGMVEYEIRVFTAWGQLLWESTALDDLGRPAEGWDGYYQGKLMHQDAYIWKASATFEDGTIWQGQSLSNGTKKKIGSVTLIR
ncbi:MAG: PKD domain-containing protein [Bacteroidia bacterium]